MKTIVALALALSSTMAQATIFNVSFNVTSDDWVVLGAPPYGLSAAPVLNGTLTIDDTLSGGSAFTSLDYVTGTRTWTLADIDLSASSVTVVGDMLQQFALVFIDQGNYVYSNNTVQVNDNAGAGIFCNSCVTISVNAVPEPASWALMIAGFGLVGTALRRRLLVAA